MTAADIPPFVADALCAQVDPELWFPDKGGAPNAARAICGRCDVQAECLDYALARGDLYGIWGGKSEHQRRAIRRRRIGVAA